MKRREMKAPGDAPSAPAGEGPGISYSFDEKLRDVSDEPAAMAAAVIRLKS